MPSITRRAPREPDHRATVEAQVLGATERLLAGGANFTELGVKQIADEAGIARSTFYVHFADKTDLIIRLAGRTRQGLLDVGVEWQAHGLSSGLDRLIEMYAGMIRHYREHIAVLAAVEEVAAYDKGVRDFWDGQVKQSCDVVAAMLEEEKQAGRAAADLDPVLAARVMTWGGERIVARHVAVGDPADDAAVARELALQRWYGVYRRPAAEPSALR
jgi:AcrR family transcriptional regulator